MRQKRRKCQSAGSSSYWGFHSRRTTTLRVCRPEIFNCDQGAQFTSMEFTKRLRSAEVDISMDGRQIFRQHPDRTIVSDDQI